MFMEHLITPFLEYDFMRSALISCFFLSVSSIPLGVFVILRRMGLMGEALAHGILPGIAVAFLVSGLSVFAMTIGGMLAGLCVVLLSQFVAKKSILPEDSSLTAFYIIFLSIGFLLISIADGGIHLTHILFGNILSISDGALYMIVGLSLLTIIFLLFFGRALLWISFDPVFCENKGIKVNVIDGFFMVFVVLNIVASCQALGTLMALGLMLLPPISMRLLTQNFSLLMCLSILTGCMGSFVGILFSFYFNLASGPSIILCLGVVFIIAFIYRTFFKIQTA